MNSVVFPSQYVKFPLLDCLNKKLNLGRPVLFLQDASLAFVSHKGIQPSVSSIKSDESRSSRTKLPQQSSAAGRTKKVDFSKKLKFSGDKIPRSAKQEEILALFRRIRSSISNAEAETKEPNASFSATEPILEILRQSRKPRKRNYRTRLGQSTTEITTGGEGKALAHKGGVTKENIAIQNDAQDSAAKFNPTRPPSNFVRRSPITSPAISSRNIVEFRSESTAAKENKFPEPRIDEMKVPALKELAKSRGVKGYSRMKKNELLDLLRC